MIKFNQRKLLLVAFYVNNKDVISADEFKQTISDLNRDSFFKAIYDLDLTDLTINIARKKENKDFRVYSKEGKRYFSTNLSEAEINSEINSSMSNLVKNLANKIKENNQQMNKNQEF